MAKATETAYAPLTVQLKQKPPPETCSSQGLSVTCRSHGGTLPGTQGKRLARLLAAAWGRAASELAALKPPGDAAADNAKLAAGLRATADLYGSSFELRGAKLKTALEKLAKAEALRAVGDAVTDLERKGYRLGAFASGGDQSGTEGTQPPSATAVAPVPFALLSRSGRQPATDLRATSCPFPSSGNGGFTGGCSQPLYSEPSTGPIPNGLSVVRPGERVTFTIRSDAGFVSLVVTRLCSGLDVSHLPLPALLRGNAWTVHLAPGNYVATVDFSWDRNGASVDESGIVGLLVSASHSLGVTYRPHCT